MKLAGCLYRVCLNISLLFQFRLYHVSILKSYGVTYHEDNDDDDDDNNNNPNKSRLCKTWKYGTDMHRLTTGIRSEKCVVRRFRRCANVIECTYTNLDSIAYYTPKLYGIAYCSWATNLYSMLRY